MPVLLMCNRAARRLAPLGFVASVLASASACGLDEGGATVFVFSTHHATPEDGMFPEKGDDDKPREFVTDEGWEITLLESYVTMSAVSLVRCDGREYPLNMFWGPCPEDLRDTDLETLTVAGNKVPSGDYCQLLVQYGPYETPIIDEEASTRHETPDNTTVEGATIFLSGGANIDQDSDDIPFELRATGHLLVELDLSQLEGPGAPLHVGKKEDFPKELTVSKSYDRFLDGVDFDSFDEGVLQGDLMDILRSVTRVQEGQKVTIDAEDM